MEMSLPLLISEVGKAYADNLAKHVKERRLTIAQIDNAVRRILEVKFKLGLFDNPYVDESATASHHNPEHRQLARIAAASLGGVVTQRRQPSAAHQGRLEGFVHRCRGPLADSKRDMRGPWTLADDEKPLSAWSKAFAKVGPGVRLITHRVSISVGRIRQYSPYSPARVLRRGRKRRSVKNLRKRALARSSNLVVLVLGEHEEMSGEAASHSTIDLPGRQRELLEAVSALGKPTVLVLINGRPVDISGP